MGIYRGHVVCTLAVGPGRGVIWEKCTTRFSQWSRELTLQEINDFCCCHAARRRLGWI